MTPHIVEKTFSDTNGYQRLHILAGSGVAPVEKTAQATLAAVEARLPIEREWGAAQGDPERLRAEAKVAAREAGASGKKADKALLKRARRAVEYLEELELDLEAAGADVRACYQRHLVAIDANAKALSKEADLAIEAGQATLAAASKMARTGTAQLVPALTIRNAINGVQDSQGFVPVQPIARNTEFGQGGAVEPYIGIAVDNLSTALGYSAQIVEQLKADAKRAASMHEIDDDLVGPFIHDEDDEDDDE